MIDTTVAPGAAHPLVPQLQGPFVRARARQINYQVPSFVGKNSKKSQIRIQVGLTRFLLVQSELSPNWTVSSVFDSF
jgi:hypothetical protein